MIGEKMNCPKADCEGKINESNRCSDCDEWYSDEYLNGYQEGFINGRAAGEEKAMDRMRRIL